MKRAHEGLGHPSKDRFLRILKYSKASEKVLELAKNLKCTVCERFKKPAPSRQAHLPRRSDSTTSWASTQSGYGYPGRASHSTA